MLHSIGNVSCSKNNIQFGKLQKKEIINPTPEDSVELSTKKAKKPSKIKTFFNKTKTILATMFGAVVSGLAVFFALSGSINKLNEENEDLTTKNTGLQAENDGLKTRNNELEAENKKLQSTIEGIVIPKDIGERVDSKVIELSERELGYSPIYVYKPDEEVFRGYASVDDMDYSDAITLPEQRECTSNRADAVALKYPKFISNTPYHFEFPMSEEVKVTKEESDFTPIELTKTTISESYADSLNWDNDKIARDLMQNFFDGHGQTLDGVSVDIVPCENGKHRVKISGKSTYSADKAILLGESSKKGNLKAAGCYGEGLKMVILKLLKEKGANDVQIASGDWKINWQFEESGVNDKRVLAYELDKSEYIDGNYIEFETDDTYFIKAILDTYDRFYHYNNPAFKCPDFENDLVGIKILENNDEWGKVFIAGQEFEVQGTYDGLKGANIFLKQKPPEKYSGEYIFDPSRDRVSLSEENLAAIGKWLASKENTSKEDAAKILHALIDYWGEDYSMSINMRHMKQFTNSFIFGCAMRPDRLMIKFPYEKYVADSHRVTEALKADYRYKGYTICNSGFNIMGMKSIGELITEKRKHKSIVPTEEEKNKILILKDAIKLLAPYMNTAEYEMFSPEETDTKIYVFDRTSKEECSVYEKANAEAIIDGGKSCGFWIDKSYLDAANFSDALATALHELTHKYGGDESAVFSYGLTHVLRNVIQGIADDSDTALQLKILEDAWNAQNSIKLNIQDNSN